MAAEITKVTISAVNAKPVKKIATKFLETIPFRLFHMPCCGMMMCWVMPRYPVYCPRCGKHVLVELMSGEHTRIIDDNAELRLDQNIPKSRDDGLMFRGF